MSTPRPLIAVVAVIVGGFLAHLAFPQASIWPLAIGGLALLMWAITGASARWAFALGSLWGIAHFLPLLWWAYASVGPIPWVALAISQSLLMGLAPAIYIWLWRLLPLRNVNLLAPILFAATWVVAEQLRHEWPFGGFPWVRIAFSQTDGPLVRLAPLGGAPLVGFAVALAAGFVAVGIMAMQRQDIVRAPFAVLLVALLLLGPLFIGFDTRAEAGRITVGAVQGNISNPGLDAFDNAREVTGNHRDGTLRLAAEQGDLDIVLWPENASDYDPRVDAEARAMVNEAAAAAGAPVLVGTARYADGTRYNEVVIWDGHDGEGQVYAKQVPAAFAEYIPMREWIRPIAPVVDRVGIDMSPGTEPALLNVPVAALDREVPIATIICFEVAYDWLISEAVRLGAEFLYVPTNNASFGETTESVQQLGMTRFRAIEHGRAAIQISTVGVSGVVAPDGTMTNVTELFTAAEFAQEIPLRTSLTWASRLGDWPIRGLSILVGIGLFISLATYRVPVKRGS